MILRRATSQEMIQ